MARKVGRKGNPEALKNYRETKRRESEEQEEASVAGAIKVGEVELKGEFAGLLVALRQAQQKRTTKEAVALITEAFGKLDDASLSEIANTPIVRDILGKVSTIGEDRLPPGSYIVDKEGRVIGRVPWTVQDIKDTFPMVDCTPAETIPITFHGHSVQFTAFQEIRCPSIFVDIYKQHLQALREMDGLNVKALEDHFGPGKCKVEAGWRKTE